MESFIFGLIYTMLFIFLLGMVFCLLGTRRNNQVYKEKERCLDWCSEDNYKHWDEREKLYEKYSYDEMLKTFWKPVKSFYNLEE